jgi:hypothetical protein
MAKFKWHADYFDDGTSGRCVRRAIIEADNACHAEKSAKAQMGLCKRVEVRRMATVSPIRIAYAHEEPRKKMLSPAESISFRGTAPSVAVAG